MRISIPYRTLVSCFLCLCFFFMAADAAAISAFPDTSKLRLTELHIGEPVVYKPVCADNGKSYVNKAAAYADGTKPVTLGRCSNYEPIKCENPGRIWISKVELNVMSEESGAEGYLNATNVVLDVYKKVENVISLYGMPGSSVGVFQWKVWIDFDGDNLFEADEAILDDVAQNISVPFYVPGHVKAGTLTRMRVFMGPRGEDLDSGVINKGEVEDYTVEILY